MKILNILFSCCLGCLVLTDSYGAEGQSPFNPQRNVQGGDRSARRVHFNGVEVDNVLTGRYSINRPVPEESFFGRILSRGLSNIDWCMQYYIRDCKRFYRINGNEITPLHFFTPNENYREHWYRRLLGYSLSRFMNSDGSTVTNHNSQFSNYDMLLSYSFDWGSYKENLDKLQNQCADLSRENSALLSNNKNLLKTVEELTKERDDLSHTKEYLSRENSALLSNNKNLLEKVKKLTKERDSLSHTNECLSRENNALLSNNKNLLEKVKKLTKERDDLSHTNEYLSRENNALLSNNKNLFEKSRRYDALEKQYNDLLQKVKKGDNDLSKKNSELLRRIRALEEEKSKKDEECEFLSDKYEKLSKQFKQLNDNTLNLLQKIALPV